MRALEFIRDHVTFKLTYDFSYQMKTPYTVIQDCEWANPLEWGPCEDVKCGIGREVHISIFASFYYYL